MSIVWSGVTEFAAALDRVATRTRVETRAAISEMASEMEKKAKQNASGRPGPTVVSGTLRRSIKHDPITPWGLGGWQTKIGVTIIYGRRIELGFTGVDSIGRRYNAPAYPYFGPAFRSTDFQGILHKHVLTALMG